MAGLEAAASARANRLALTCRRILSVTGNNEVVRAKIGDQIVERDNGEDEDAFVRRAKAEARATATLRPCRLTSLPTGAHQ